jgi:ribosome assembly protein YihI (activator of Der GTPase)
VQRSYLFSIFGLMWDEKFSEQEEEYEKADCGRDEDDDCALFLDDADETNDECCDCAESGKDHGAGKQGIVKECLVCQRTLENDNGLSDDEEEDEEEEEV